MERSRRESACAATSLRAAAVVVFALRHDFATNNFCRQILSSASLTHDRMERAR